VPYSEAELLIDIADWLPQGRALIGLVGGGQEIYSGEEGGIGQWAEAIAASPRAAEWRPLPANPRECIASLTVTTEDLLHLDVSMRFRRADRLYDWVHPPCRWTGRGGRES
jgi:hypothetical protein